MRTRRKLGIALLVLLPVAAGAQGSANTAAAGQTTATSVAPEGYVIGPEDVLNISVWHEQELSGSEPVRPDGKISIALLNDVQAAGLTPTQLSQTITEGLKKFVATPQVTVTVTQINSKRIYVLGQVSRPGAFPMLPEMTVLQALSSAGSLTQYAKTKKIYVLRKQGGKTTKFDFNYKQVIQGKNPEQDVVLIPGDTIVVP